MKPKVVSAQDAASLIKTGDTIGMQAFVMVGCAEEILSALEERFLKTGEPRDLTIFYGAGIGDFKTRGLNHLAHKGLVRRVIGSHWFVAPRMCRLAENGDIEAYNIPQGVGAQMFRAAAAKQPGVFTHVGLGTYIDPRVEGGKVNKNTTEDIVKLVDNLDGRELLWYKTDFPINVGIIRGTTADEYGNITCEKEAIKLGIISVAQSVKNCNGIVICQVERLAKGETLNASHVQVPGMLVDYIVVADPENHKQTMVYDYNPAYCGEIRVPTSVMHIELSGAREIICKRAAEEITAGSIVAFGIGVSEGVASVADKQGRLKDCVPLVESGHIGGIPATGGDFGCSWNPQAIIETADQFGFIHGGGLDQAYLGMAQVDKEGNVNVTKFGGRLAGPGGFIDISQNSKEVYFCGTFTAGDLDVDINDEGKLIINKEGKHLKFLNKVDQISFSGNYARSRGQKVKYITERAVFSLEQEGLVLTEIASGIDLEKEILAKMEFRPKIADNLKVMECHHLKKVT